MQPLSFLFASESAHCLLSCAVWGRDQSGCCRLCGQGHGEGCVEAEARGGYLDAEGAEGLGEDHDLVFLDGVLDNLLANSGGPSAVAIAKQGQRSWSTTITATTPKMRGEGKGEACRGAVPWEIPGP
jgi:hypothetical protein